MLLTESMIQPAVEQVGAAFPNFANWEYNNEVNEYYFGFALWGEFIPDPKELMPQRFFVTFNTRQEQWFGNLTIGKPSYFWTNADVGDANLLGTEACATLQEAIAALQLEIRKLFGVLLPLP